MSNQKCDHYWLIRRGGDCPHCGDVFPGQFGTSKHELQQAKVEGWMRRAASNAEIRRYAVSAGMDPADAVRRFGKTKQDA